MHIQELFQILSSRFLNSGVAKWWAIAKQAIQLWSREAIMNFNQLSVRCKKETSLTRYEELRATALLDAGLLTCGELHEYFRAHGKYSVENELPFLDEEAARVASKIQVLTQGLLRPALRFNGAVVGDFAHLALRELISPRQVKAPLRCVTKLSFSILSRRRSLSLARRGARIDWQVPAALMFYGPTYASVSRFVECPHSPFSVAFSL
jgi:hypothetical protein